MIITTVPQKIRSLVTYLQAEEHTPNRCAKRRRYTCCGGGREDFSLSCCDTVRNSNRARAMTIIPSLLFNASKGFIMILAQQHATCTKGPSLPSHIPDPTAKHLNCKQNRCQKNVVYLPSPET